MGMVPEWQKRVPSVSQRMCPLCQVSALFISLCQAKCSTCSSLHAVPSSVFTPAVAVVCALHIAELRGSAFRDTQCSQSRSDSVLVPRKMCWEILGWSLRHFENFQNRGDTNSLTWVPISSSWDPLMSVWGEPRACELVNHWCSTRASACPAPASVWLCALGVIDASGRIPVRSFWKPGHSQSSACYWAGAGYVRGRALCRCQANNRV